MTQFRYHLAISHYNIGNVYGKLNRWDDALASMDQATGLLKALVEAEPSRTDFEEVLASCLASLGASQMKNGRPADAAMSLREAVRRRERQPSQTAESYFLSAGHHTKLAALATDRASGLSAAEGQAEASRGLDALRKAVDAGFRDPDRLRAEPDLDPIRSVPDFRILEMRVLDRVFPAGPFAQ